MSESPSDVTALLKSHAEGNREALGELFQLVYRELRSMARKQRRLLNAGDTLDSVALVNECYMKLLRSDGLPPRDRGHFFAVAASAMRHLLVDYARSRRRAKRHGVHVELEPDELAMVQQTDTVLAVHQALDRLAVVDPRLVAVTECRYFAGLSVPETAEALGVSVSTVERSWRAVRGFLGRELAASASGPGIAGA